MGPLRGDGNLLVLLRIFLLRREDGSPSWGRKLFASAKSMSYASLVEKMGPLRGDGNFAFHNYPCMTCTVEKMGPLRGDGNHIHWLTILTNVFFK